MNHPTCNTITTTIPNPIETPESRSTLARIIESIRPQSRVGYVFHEMRGDKLSRRGLVVGETPAHLIVSYCDVFGMPSETKKLSKDYPASWQWFVDVEHSNIAYDKIFGVN